MLLCTVCTREVKSDMRYAVVRSTDDGSIFYFHAKACLSAFNRNPGKYVPARKNRAVPNPKTISPSVHAVDRLEGFSEGPIRKE